MDVRFSVYTLLRLLLSRCDTRLNSYDAGSDNQPLVLDGYKRSKSFTEQLCSKRAARQFATEVWGNRLFVLKLLNTQRA